MDEDYCLEGKAESDAELMYCEKVRTLFTCYSYVNKRDPDFRRELEELRKEAKQLAHDLSIDIEADRVLIRGGLLNLLTVLAKRIARAQPRGSPPTSAQEKGSQPEVDREEKRPNTPNHQEGWFGVGHTSVDTSSSSDKDVPTHTTHIIIISTHHHHHNLRPSLTSSMTQATTTTTTEETYPHLFTHILTTTIISNAAGIL